MNEFEIEGYGAFRPCRVVTFDLHLVVFFFSSRRRHTRYIGDWSSDVCSSDLTWRAVAIGAIFLRTFRDGPTFSDEDVRFVQVVAALTAQALRNAHRYERLAQRQQRSEERRVGKECRSRWPPDRYKQEKSVAIE